MAVSKALGTYGDGVGVVTPLDHKLAHLGLLAKANAGTNAIRSGLFYDGVSNIVLGKANMSYDVVAFTAAISRGALQGAVLLANDGVVNVATTAAPGSNSRIDVIYVWPREFAIDGVNSTPVIGVAQGAPASSPVAPSIPAGALELARAVVPAGVTATNSGVTITQTAPFTALHGGPLVRRTVAELATITTPRAGQMCEVLDDGSMYRYSGSAWQQWDVPWQSYVPTLNGVTVGNGTVVGKWKMADRVVFMEVVFTLGSTSVMANHAVSTPTSILNLTGGQAAGQNVLLDASAGTAGRYVGPLVHNSATSLRANRIDSVDGRYVNLTATAPFTWAVGDQVIYSASYISA